MVRKGGLYVNYERVASTDEMFHKDRHLLAGNTTHIRIGIGNNITVDPRLSEPHLSEPSII